MSGSHFGSKIKLQPLMPLGVMTDIDRMIYEAQSSNGIDATSTSPTSKEDFESLDFLGDTNLANELRAYEGECRNLNATNAIIKFLSKNPTNIGAQRLYRYYIYNLHEQFISICYRSTSFNPLIPIIYDKLFELGQIGFKGQFLYLKYQSEHDPYNAGILFERFIKLLPNTWGLYDIAVSLSQKTHNLSAQRYLQNYTNPKVLWSNYKIIEDELPFEVVQVVLKIIEKANEMLQFTFLYDFGPMIKNINRLLDLYKGGYNVHLKDFYHIAARVFSRSGDNLEAYRLIRFICEIDPLNITYAKELREILKKIQSDAVTKFHANTDSHEHLTSIFESVEFIDFLDLRFIVDTAKSYSKQGKLEISKSLLEELMSFNLNDADYLELAIELNEVLKIEEWQSELFKKIELICSKRPWEVNARVLENKLKQEFLESKNQETIFKSINEDLNELIKRAS